MAEQTAGWFNDPYGRFQQRYFDGTAWTEHVATGGKQKVDPLGASAVIPFATPPTAFASGDGNGAGVIRFLDSVGPDSHARPAPSLRAAVAGLGGAVLAIGVLAVIVGDDGSRGALIATSMLLVGAAWANRMFVKVPAVQAAAVGMVVVGIPALVGGVTVSNDTGGFWTGLLMAVLFIAAWAFPSFKGRTLLLGLGAIALVSAFGSLTSTESYEETGGFLPVDLTNNVGDEGTVYLFGGVVYLGLTWWLDRRGHRGTATAFSAAGLFSTLVGTGMLASNFGESSAPVFVLFVGLVVSLVGSHGGRRATTWWGAALAAIATVWFVTVQWEPDSASAIGGVMVASGVVLVLITLLVAPIQSALQAGKSAPAAPPDA